MSADVDLEEKLAAANDPIIQVDLLNAAAEELDDLDHEQSRSLFERAAAQARAQDYHGGLAWALTGLAKLAGDRSQFDEMERLCLEALEESAGQPPHQAAAWAQVLLGWLCYYQGEYTSGLNWGLGALETARKAGSCLREAQALDITANIYAVVEDFTLAQSLQAEALRVVETCGDRHEHAVILNNTALTLMSAGNLEAALETSLKGLDLAQQAKMTPYISNHHDTLATILLEMGQVERAETMQRAGMAISTAVRPDYLHALQIKNLAKICLARKKYGETAELLAQAGQDFEQLGARPEQADCHRLFSQLYEEQGDFAAALARYKAYDQLREVTVGKDIARRISTLKAGFEIQLAQRDAEIARLRTVELQNEIDERKRVQAALEKLALVDSLTCLTNRGHFFTLAGQEVERAVRYEHSLTAMMIDIDHFKAVNDRYGHLTGDEVLGAVAATIRGSLRDVDIAGRFGGEEFVVMLPETNLERGAVVAERIRTRVSGRPLQTAAGSVGVTVSIGVAALGLERGEPAKELTSLLDRADRALYRAKQSGRDRVQCSVL